RHWPKTTPNFRANYWRDFHYDDAPLHPFLVAVQDGLTSRDDAPRYSQPSSHSDDPSPKRTNIGQRDSVHHSSQDASRPPSDHSAASQDQDVYTSAQRTTETHPEVRPLLAALSDRPRSSVLIDSDQLREALETITAGNQFIAYELLEPEPVYDFTV